MQDYVLPTVLASIGYFVVALAGGAAVLKITGVSPKWMQFCNAFASGVLIGVALCHMLAENAEMLEGWGLDFSKALGGEGDEAFPLGNALAGCGFFLLVGIEYLLGGGHDHKMETARGPSALENGNGHEEANGEDKPIAPELKGSDAGGIATLIGVTIHSFIEGIATGAAASTDAFGVLVLAVLLHKGFAAFAVAASLSDMLKRSLCLWWCLVIFFALTGPVGIALGVLLEANIEGAKSAALTCLAAGTLLAVGITEMLMPALEDIGEWKKRKLFAAFFGYAAMSLLAVWA